MTCQEIADRINNSKPITYARVKKLQGCCQRAGTDLTLVLDCLPANVVAKIKKFL